MCFFKSFSVMLSFLFSIMKLVQSDKLNLSSVSNFINRTGNSSSNENATQVNGNSAPNQCQLFKYRFFLGRRRNIPSRPFRSNAVRGAARPQSHRTTPPRYCDKYFSFTERLDRFLSLINHYFQIFWW